MAKPTQIGRPKNYQISYRADRDQSRRACPELVERDRHRETMFE